MAALRYHVCLAFGFAAFHATSPAWSTTPVQLNGILVQNGDVSATSLQISPDGNFVLYIADQDIDGADEVFVVPITGGTAVKMNGALPSTAKVTNADFSPDGQRIVYHANQDNVPNIELYGTSISGSPIKLNGTLTPIGNVGTTQFTADGRIIYVADQDTATVLEVFAVPIVGGDSIKLNGPMISSGDAQLVPADFESGIVVYVADQEVDQRMELYGAAIDGSAQWKLSGVLQSQGNVNSKGVRVTPGSTRVIYLADELQDEVHELFSVPAAGGEAVRLNPQLVSGGDVLPNPIQLSPLGDRVLYLADQNVDETFEIFTVPVAGGPSVRVNGTLVAGGNVRENSLQFSPDGDQVLYIADQIANEVYELFVAPSTGGDSLRLNSQLVSSGDVTAAAFSSDGERVVYIADRFTNDIFELFSVPTAGGESIRLNEALTSLRDVSDFEITPDGQYVVYLSDQEVDEKYELYAVPIEGGEIRKLNGEMIAFGDVKSWLISPDGSQIVYRADQNIDEQFEIFSVSLLDHVLPGDFTGDGLVDAADYTAWRDGLGGEYDMDDYTDWKNNFGANSTSGNAAAATVPEPASCVLLFCTFAWMAMPAQSRKSCSARREGTYSSVT